MSPSTTTVTPPRACGDRVLRPAVQVRPHDPVGGRCEQRKLPVRTRGRWAVATSARTETGRDVHRGALRSLFVGEWSGCDSSRPSGGCADQYPTHRDRALHALARVAGDTEGCRLRMDTDGVCKRTVGKRRGCTASAQRTLRCGDETGGMAGAHLLIVDDEENLRSMLAAALRHHGFEVSSAATGREALDAVSERTPDLVVLDVMLPDLDGFEVCRRLRTAGDHTPVLFLTARDATEDKVRGLTLGGDDYLQKPFSLEELVARTTAVLRRTGRARDQRNVFAVRRRRARRRRPPRHQRWRGGRPLADRVQPPALPARQPGSRGVEGADPRPRVAVRLRRRRRGRRDVRRLPPAQAGHARQPKLITTIRGIGYTIRADGK